MTIQTKHAFIALSLIFILLISYAATPAAKVELKSIPERLSNNRNWTGDKTEVGYISLRCGTLLLLISQVFLSDNRRIDTIVKQADLIKERSSDLIGAGIEISKSQGLPSQLIEIRVEELSNVYVQLLTKNRALHNNIFEGVAGEDFNFCKSLL
jgi:hypothetical protein